MVEGYFSGMSKWVSKWFIELCGDFVQFWGGGRGGLRWGGFLVEGVSGTHTQDLAAGT